MRFKVNLPSLLQCLTVFGLGSKLETTAFRMAYHHETGLLLLQLHEARCKTDCEIATFDVADEDEEEEAMSFSEMFM